MWNKRTDQVPMPGSQMEPSPGNPSPPVAAAAPAPVAAPAAAAPKAPAVIGASMRVKGEIRAQEELMVDGDVEGSVESQSRLVVGQNGRVKANIKAREVFIYGSVTGNVEATETVAIRDNGRLLGDIRSAGIRIDDGAYFKGSVEMVNVSPKSASPAGPIAATAGRS